MCETLLRHMLQRMGVVYPDGGSRTPQVLSVLSTELRGGLEREVLLAAYVRQGRKWLVLCRLSLGLSKTPIFSYLSDFNL